MSSGSDTAKKRKVLVNNKDVVVEGLESSSSAAAMMAEMKAHMTRMQNELTQQQNEIDGMKSKCNKLEAECDSLERSMQILIKESTWKYSAPPIPTSHWIDRGFGEEYIEGMERLLEQMKNRTIELRSGKNVRQYIILNGGFEYDEETVLLHDDLLLPHWKEFANALQMYHNSSRLLNLSIRNVQLTSSVMDLLASSLKGKKILENFELNRNEFVNVREGIEFAVEIVGENPNLEEFDWLHNPIGSMDNARYLVDTITTHPHIGTVCLEKCFGNYVNGYEILRPLFTSGKSFSIINLMNTNIRTGGGTAISDFLATNPPLEQLRLAGNHLNDDDAVLIAGALKQNNNLQYLHLGDNNLTEKGKNALSNAIYDSTSLNSMVDCNHTCTISGVDFGDIPENHGRPKSDRARKIYHLLSLRNKEGSNVKYLNSEFDTDDDDNSTLVLVPKVLESVHRYSRHRYKDSICPLSIMYEILRSWKMPELYEK